MANSTTQLTIIADASGVEAGVGKAKRSLKDLGVTAENAGKQGAAGFEKIGAASASAKRAIDASISRLQTQAAVIGKSATDAKLFELRQRGATAAQLASAEAALRTVAAHKAQAEAVLRSEAAYTTARASAARYGAFLGTLAVASVAAATAIARSTISGLDALNDVKDATGASIENLSALEDIAARTGTKFDAVETSLVKFNAVLKDIKAGSEAANVLKAIGLSADELKRLDPAEALRRTAVALSQYADDGGKARAVQELFGKSVREVAPFLADLAKQGQLNATVTTAQAEAAEAFNQQMSRLEKNIKDSARALVSDMLPALNEFFDRLESNRKAGGFFASIGNEIKANLSSDRLRVVVDSIENVQALLNKEPGNVALLAQMRDLRTEADKLSRDAMRASDALKGFASIANPARESAGGGRGFVNPEIQKPGLVIPDATAKVGGGRSERVNEAERYIDSLRKQLEGTKQLTAVEQVLADIEAKRIKGIDAATAGKAFDIAQQIDAANARTKLLAEEQKSREAGAQLAQRSLQAASQEAAQMIEGNEALREEIQIIGAGEQARRAIEQARLGSALALKEETLAMLQNAGASAAEIQVLQQQIELLRQRGQLLGRRDAANDLAGTLSQQAANAERFTDILARGAGDAVTNFRNLRGVLQSVGDQLNQLAIQTIVIDPLKDTLRDFLKAGGGSGGIADFAGSLFGFNKGGAAQVGATAAITAAQASSSAAIVAAIGASTASIVAAVSVGGATEGAGSLFGDLGSIFNADGFGLPGFAGGGRPTVGRASWVGENGPELFIPDMPGRILTAGDSKAAVQAPRESQRGLSVVNNFSISGPVDRRTQEQIARAAGSGVQRALARGTA